MNWKCFFLGHKKDGPWFSSQEINLVTHMEIPSGRILGEHKGVIQTKFCTRCDKECATKRIWGERIGDMDA